MCAKLRAATRHSHRNTHLPACAWLCDVRVPCNDDRRAGFDKPSAIQQRAIVPIIKGKDLIAQSQSGTGKTAVFSIGTLASLDLNSKDLQALVLSPTRELAVQSQKVIKAIGDHMNVRCHACIGGKSIGDDIRQLCVVTRCGCSCAPAAQPLRRCASQFAAACAWCACAVHLYVHLLCVCS